MITEVYEPREDSFLLADAVKKYAKGKVLDMCTGTGIQAITAAKSQKAKHIIAVDINKEAVEYAKKYNSHKKIKYAVSNIFSRVRGSFDTIICNPPYLPFPSDKKSIDIALDGGEKGYEFTEKFLDNAGKYLEPDGAILLLFSTLTKKDAVEKIMERNCFGFEKIAEQSFDFEKIFVYRLFYPKEIRFLIDKKISEIKRLTKGHRGLIFTGRLKGKKVAVKIQRKDISATETVNNESKKLKLLNRHGIGPKLILSGNDFFVYEFVEGEFILDFFRHSGRAEIINTICNVFMQMKKLDELGLNKEEMHHPLKHVIISKIMGKNSTNRKVNVTLLDFERCRHAEKTHNVTQFCEFIARISNILASKGIFIEPEKIRKLASGYNKDKEKFDEIIGYISR